MELIILALVLVLLATAVIAWIVMARAEKGGGPPDGQGRPREGASEQRPPEGAPEPEVESERLANRSR